MLLRIAMLFLILPCRAKITIDITVASSKQFVKVKYSGTDDKIITDREVALFNVTDNNLKAGLKIQFGKAPDNVFLREPTPYFYLYQEFKWQQVHRHMIIRQATILDVIHQRVTLKTVEHINNSTITQKIKKSLADDVESTVFSFWSKEGFPNDNIPYDVCITFATKKHCFKNKWRDSTFESINEPIGAQVKGSVTLNPGQTIISKLVANKTIIFVEFQYSAKLIGQVIADYDRLFGKYHFYAPDVSDVMKFSNLKNDIVTTERIEIRGYSDPKLVMLDKDTGEEIRLYRRIKLVGSEKRRRIVFLDH